MLSEPFFKPTFLKLIFFLGVCFLFLGVGNLSATSGRLNQEGCHNSKKVGYHCHEKKFAGEISEANGQPGIHNKKYNQKYNRKEWGQWIDKDQDCQNERHEMLIVASETPVTFKDKNKCWVSRGEWLGPYTGEVFTHSSQIEIDHLVPVKEAFISGGKHWTKAQKSVFYNDPINLIPVSKKANRSKGAQDIAHWLPERKEFVCEYLNRWVRVKEKYNLSQDEKEKKKITQLEKKCGESARDHEQPERLRGS